jgi:DNA-binding transcriptional regulator GbsR (MarR family)
MFHNLLMELTTHAQNFILHWGEMGSRWGVNRSVAQIHALLFYAGRPLPADEIASTLDIARSNVSNSLKELQNWQLIRPVHLMGDRREHFDTSLDVWTLFRTVVSERKQREFDPTINVLKATLAAPDFSQEDAGAQQRVKETLALMETLSVWADEMLRLESSTLVKVMKLGAKVSSLVRSK